MGMYMHMFMCMYVHMHINIDIHIYVWVYATPKSRVHSAATVELQGHRKLSPALAKTGGKCLSQQGSVVNYSGLSKNL